MPNGQPTSFWSATAFSQVFGESAACVASDPLYRTIFSAAEFSGAAVISPMTSIVLYVKLGGNH
jgi:hypothetical protein